MPIIESTDIDALIRILLNDQAPHPVYSEKAPGYQLRGRNEIYDYNPTKYELKNVTTLLQRLSFACGEDRSLEDYAIRYVIANNDAHQAYFSLEGKEEGDISAHERLSSTCLAAGMLRFDKRNGSIYLVGLDHDSGYFQPTQQCLVWPLLMLANTKVFNLDKQMSIYCRADANTTVRYNVDTAFLLQQIKRVSPRVSSFAPTQACSDSYEQYKDKLEQPSHSGSSDVLFQHIKGAVVLDKEDLDAEIESTTNKRAKLSTPETEADSIRMAEFQTSLEALKFSQTSAFTFWQPKQGAKLSLETVSSSCNP